LDIDLKQQRGRSLRDLAHPVTLAA
jgi:hypothetical protein